MSANRLMERLRDQKENNASEMDHLRLIHLQEGELSDDDDNDASAVSDRH